MFSINLNDEKEVKTLQNKFLTEVMVKYGVSETYSFGDGNWKDANNDTEKFRNYGLK